MTGKKFSGFSKDAVRFLKDLKANNNREWFNANKKIYETEIKKPAKAFCEAMTEDLSKLTGRDHSSKIFRIHRDVRFSKDKTPYNTHLHIGFMPTSEMNSPPCWFFGLDTEKLTLGTGIFAFDKPALETFRERVAGSEGPKLAKLLGKLEANGMRVSGAELKRVPPGYPKDHPQAELLCRKGLAVWVDSGGADQATNADLVKSCRSSFKQLKPVFDWLMD
ncbi:MAG: DUF2461 domain-containing protein [Geminicoccaceae bacterium]